MLNSRKCGYDEYPETSNRRMAGMEGFAMPKIQATAEEIRNEILRRIQGSSALDGDCRECRAPTPYPTDPDTNGGCNWRVDTFPGVIPGCLEHVKEITRAVMYEYDLIK